MTDQNKTSVDKFKEFNRNQEIVDWIRHICSDFHSSSQVNVNLTDDKMYYDNIAGEIRTEINFCPFCGKNKEECKQEPTHIYRYKRGW